MPQATALLLTLAVEVPLYVAALVSLRLASVRRALLVAVAANLVTHPTLWWAVGDRPSLLVVAVAEAAVWLVEALLLWVAVRRSATAVRRSAAALRGSTAVLLVVAAGVNAASILAGALIAVLAGAA